MELTEDELRYLIACLEVAGSDDFAATHLLNNDELDKKLNGMLQAALTVTSYCWDFKDGKCVTCGAPRR